MEIRIRKRSDCSDADPIDITEYWRRAAQREIEMGRAMATAGCAPQTSQLGATDSLVYVRIALISKLLESDASVYNCGGDTPLLHILAV